MHQPRPHGFTILGDEPTLNDLALITKLAHALTNQKDISNLDSLKLVRDLPDGGTVIAQDMGGIFKIFVEKSHSIDKKLKRDGLAKFYIPMLFSGVFKNLWYHDHDPFLPIKITEQTRKRLAGYTGRSIDKDLRLNRFVIEYDNSFKYFEPKNQGSHFKHTQFMRLKPTWYSGAMAEVVQIVSGYGKQGNTDFPEDSIENISMLPPDDWYIKILEEIDRQALPSYSGFPDREGKLKYDYKQTNNDLVSFDSTNKPWLVRVSDQGVYAMPLPIVPATATNAFRDYLNEVGDSELLKIIDRFGGMPSGESFPSGGDFQAWERAGAIIKVCDSADFYQHQAMYAASGWSVNSKGTEGFNTCWSYAENGLLHVHSYKLKLNLGPSNNGGWINPQSTNSQVIGTYISKLFQLLNIGQSSHNAIMYKIRRAPEDDIYQRALTSLYDPLGVTSNDVDYWDNYIAKPLASHSGSLVRTLTGPVYWGLKMYPQSMGRLKFPELTGQGCASFVMVSPDYDGGFIKCDTVMFGCYVEDQLKVIKYFIDERKVQQQEESTYEEIMIVGEWEKTTTTSLSGVNGYFYTSDFDDRKLSSPSSVYTHIKGTDLGYGNPAFQTPGLFVTHGGLSRARYYKHETTTKTISSDGMDCAACVPAFNRDCILYAYEQLAESTTVHEKHTRGAVADPTSYPLWTYDPIFHYLGGFGKGKPIPTTGNYVYVYGPANYTPTKYSDFADQGDWFGVGSGYKDVSSICAPYTDRGTGTHQASGVLIGGEAPEIQPYEKTETIQGGRAGRVDITYQNANGVNVHRNLPQPWYYSFSPVKTGGELLYFYRDACKVVFGDSSYANISDEAMQDGRRRKWGFTTLADHTSHHHFIGVINE